jgi:uncharacterized protein YaeQ
LAQPSTLYRFSVDLSDVERNLYQPLEFRVAMHPSESTAFFITRVLAYCLNFKNGLEFSPGISAPDDPALFVRGLTGGIELWIDIGNPAAKRIHKAAKSAKAVLVYTHKDSRILAKEWVEEKVHRLNEIGLYSLDRRFLESIGSLLERDNHLEITRNEGELYVGIGKETFRGLVERILLSREI